ncbi:MAG: hypothetical protein U0989_07675 [Azonexus sp.]|nr:hypothetical protein [Azonexus sp.]MDP3636434.1 hypothetical protein [Azonexus sp.]MDZ4314630.1 hypothetical protein [Azonexus sp.]
MKQMGKELIDLKDADGKAFVQEREQARGVCATAEALRSMMRRFQV